MNLPPFIIIFLSISVTIASPVRYAPLRYIHFPPHENHRSSDWTAFASETFDRMISSLPPSKLDPPIDYKTRFNDMSVEALNNLALRIHNPRDILNLALASKAFHDAPVVTLILNIRRHCSVKGDQLFPHLTLTSPPKRKCADSIIASNGHLFIETLDMTGVQMTTLGAELIALIAQQTKLLHIILSRCSLTYTQLQKILDSLPISSLVSLDLHLNHINAEGAKAIASALPYSEITSLGLMSNEIGVDGARTIASILPESKLTSLDLGCNGIGDEGVSEIAAVLSTSKLTRLFLNYNQISDTGVAALGYKLCYSKLTLLDLASNYIGEGSNDAVYTLLDDSKLELLDLTGNHLTSRHIQSLGWEIAMHPVECVLKFDHDF